MKPIEEIEINLVLEAIYQRYGHDFREYSRSSIKRRLQLALQNADCENLAQMIEKVLYDESFFQWLLAHFSITVTEWFRDPLFFKSMKKEVIPYLKTFPFIKIWHAGCATGEEVYSLAIVLKEEGLYDKATIYATDFNDVALEKAKKGIYSLKDIQKASINYYNKKGATSFAHYIHAKYDSMIIDQALKQNITFANHNLVTDGVFGEMHLILCRNVLIYLDHSLQNKVLNLINDSLIDRGFLCLGSKESLEFSDVYKCYERTNKKQRIYQKTGVTGKIAILGMDNK